MKTVLVGMVCLAVGAGIGVFITTRVHDHPGVIASMDRPGSPLPAAFAPPAPAAAKKEGPAVVEAPRAPRAAPPVARSKAPAAQGNARPPGIAQQVEKQYGPFLASLQAQGKDAATFRRLLEERQTIVEDVLAAARDQGINLMDREAYKPVGELIRKSIKDFNVEMKETVGDQNYTAWVDSEKMKGEYNVSLELVRRLRESALELPPAQQDLFVRTLFEIKEPAGLKKVVSVMDEDGSPSLMRVVPEAAIERMRGILTAEQLQKFIELCQDQKRGVMNVPPKL